jgi:Zn-dependent protease with chaperone function
VIICILVGLFFSATFFAARMMNDLALKPWRRSKGQHWALRARLLYPARTASALAVPLLPLDGYLSAALLRLAAPAWVLGLAGVPAAFLASCWINREIFPDVGLTRWIFSALIALIFRILSFGLLVFTILTIPRNFGSTTWLAAGLLFTWLLSLRLGLGRQLLRIFGRYKPADARLAGIVAGVAGRMNLRPRHVWLYTSPRANARALPLIKGVMFSTRLMESLSDDQIASVAAHELAHLTEPRRVTALRSVQSMLFFPLIFVRPLVAMGAGGPMLACILVAGVLVLPGGLRRMRRRMEIRADAIATANQSEQATYARALEKIYEINQTPAVMRGNRRTHPNLYDRMIAAGVTPDFPRPDPPPAFTPTAFILLLTSGILLGIFLIQMHALSNNTRASFQTSAGSASLMWKPSIADSWRISGPAEKQPNTGPGKRLDELAEGSVEAQARDRRCADHEWDHSSRQGDVAPVEASEPDLGRPHG